ncbi:MULTISPECIES: hypothetical protein [Halolamina]|uniref:Uncharacterized protein n=1 Tax=Halolamina pelagica TaxID=699431 RepID=A0A1I5QTY1_9EURY|nr:MULTISPECIES: hypothetical protein [Halolamina]NHX35532.1 hypothetical protein [Halolamina sp. R1-12]SFP49481.1 hypothetical protein SAMN05216277_10476 [Halolamina pelagica]
MFDRLFPGWTAPGLLAALVALRTLRNVALTASMGEASDSPVAVLVGAALTLASFVLTVGVLRGTFGLTLSHVESLLQVALLVLAAAVVRRGDGDGRRRAVVAGVAAVLLYLFSIPLFGEATVAP